MRALMVYESMFGNTKRVAEAIADGLRERMDVVICNAAVENPADAGDFDLLLIGAPTHTFSLPRPDSRRRAGSLSDTEIPAETGVREYLDGLLASRDLRVVTFDTRHRRMRHLPGSAARAAARLLRRDGYRLLLGPESFYVAAGTGPLIPGELDRAADWGGQVGWLMTIAGEARTGSDTFR